MKKLKKKLGKAIFKKFKLEKIIEGLEKGICEYGNVAIFEKYENVIVSYDDLQYKFTQVRCSFTHDMDETPIIPKMEVSFFYLIIENVSNLTKVEIKRRQEINHRLLNLGYSYGDQGEKERKMCHIDEYEISIDDIINENYNFNINNLIAE